MKEEKTKNSKVALLSIVAIIIIALIAGLVFYFTYYTKPENIFKRAITATTTTLNTSIKTDKFKTENYTIELNAQIDADKNNNIDKSVIDLINETTFKLDGQVNYDENKINSDISFNYKGEETKIEVYVNSEGKETYISAKDVLDKCIAVDGMDDEYYDQIKEILEQYKNGKESSGKMLTILNEEINKIIKAEYCTSSSEKIQINGKEQQVTKNTIEMTSAQFSKEMESLLTNLKDNEEFIKCYKDADVVKKSLEDAISELKDIDEETTGNIKIVIFTKGLNQEIVKVGFEVKNDESKTAVKFEIIKKDKENYDIICTADEDGDVTTINGSMTYQKLGDNSYKTSINIDIPDFGKVQLNMNIKSEFNKEAENFDTSNSVKMKELTQSDYEKMLKNVEKLKIYGDIEELISQIYNSNSYSDDYNYDDYAY